MKEIELSEYNQLCNELEEKCKSIAKKYLDNNNRIISVFIKSRNFEGDDIKAEVNWSCIGSVDASYAKSFGKAVTEIASLCEEFNYQLKNKKINWQK